MIRRAAGRLRREWTKYTRLRDAKRQGLAFVPPNFVYRPDLSAESVVIDAGCSYEADFSTYLIRRHGVLAYGVDPTRKHAPALRKVEEQTGGRFVHVPCAIASTSGTVRFHESQINESGSLFADHVNVIQDETTSYDVEAITLGSLVKRLNVETVDMLKLDLEGAEYDLLGSMTPQDLAPFRQMFVEFHHHAVRHVTETDTARIVASICGFGFTAFSLDDHNYLFRRVR